MRFLYVALLLLAASPAAAGTLRYDLTNLLGEHIFDGNPSLLGSAHQIDTPFTFYQVDEAKLVVKGGCRPAKPAGTGSRSRRPLSS